MALTFTVDYVFLSRGYHGLGLLSQMDAAKHLAVVFSSCPRFLPAYCLVLVLEIGERDNYCLIWFLLYLDHLKYLQKLSDAESEWMIKKQMSKKWWMRRNEILEEIVMIFFLSRKKSLLKFAERALRTFSVLYFIRKIRGRTDRKISFFTLMMNWFLLPLTMRRVFLLEH